MIENKISEEKRLLYINAYKNELKMFAMNEYPTANDYMYLPFKYDILDFLLGINADNINDSLKELQIELEKEMLMRTEYKIKRRVTKLIGIDNIRRKIDILSELKIKKHENTQGWLC